MSRTARRLRPLDDIGTAPTHGTENQHDHLHHHLPHLRHPGRRGSEALHLDSQREDQGDVAQSAWSTEPRGLGPHGDVRALRAAVHRAERRALVQVLACLLAHDPCRFLSRDRSLLNEADGERRNGSAVRLGHRQVRRVVEGALRETGPGQAIGACPRAKRRSPEWAPASTPRSIPERVTSRAAEPHFRPPAVSTPWGRTDSSGLLLCRSSSSANLTHPTSQSSLPCRRRTLQSWR